MYYLNKTAEKKHNPLSALCGTGLTFMHDVGRDCMFHAMVSWWQKECDALSVDAVQEHIEEKIF